MKWFKHDTDASNDAKIKKLLLKYGTDGYAIYFHCIELIANDVDVTNITFELEHDSEIIADNLKVKATQDMLPIDRVNVIMKYIISLGLFELSDNKITCLSLAKRLDKSMTSNSYMRKMIEEAKNHDGVMMESCSSHDEVMKDKIRIDKIRIDKKREDKNNKNNNKCAGAKVKEAGEIKTLFPNQKSSLHEKTHGKNQGEELMFEFFEAKRSVTLSQKSYDRLIADYGHDITHDYIERVAYWEKNVVVKSAYRRIINWLKNDGVKKISEKQNTEYHNDDARERNRRALAGED